MKNTYLNKQIRKMFFFLFFLSQSYTFGQTQTSLKKEIVSLIESNCKGTPSADYYEKINCKFIDNYTFQYTIQSYEISNDNLNRKNVFTLKIKDLDFENIIISRVNNEYGLLFFTKDLKKNIKQQFFAGTGTANISYQEKFYIGEFNNIELAEALKDKLINYKKNLK